MPVGTTDFSTLIAAIDTKAQSLASSTTDAKDLVYLGKAVEALETLSTTTNVSFSQAIGIIDTKLQELTATVTDPKDLVYLAKAIESLNIPDTVSAVISEGDTQVTRVTTEGTSQLSGITTEGTSQLSSITTEGTSQLSSITTEGTSQLAAVNTAGTTQVAAVQSEGATQVAAVQAVGEGYATITYVDNGLAGLSQNSITEGDTSVTVVDNGADGKVVVRVNNADVAEFNDTHLVIPKGTTAERDPNAVVGSLRYNTTTGFFETFTSSGWGAVATPPSISNITPNNFNGEAGATFTVDGAFFDVDTTASFKGSDGTVYAAATVTFINSTQITVTNATNLPVANEPFRIKVTNGAGLSAESIQGIDAGSVPTFTTAAGNIATTTQWNEAVSLTVNATDPENTISSYAVTEGNLPAGLSLNATTGAITGTSNAQATTTYTFTIEATDSAGNTNTRQFSIQIVNAAPVWNSPAEGGTQQMAVDQAGSITLDATDPEGEAVIYSAANLPTGLNISGNLITGTPTVQANSSVAVTASDGFASIVRNFFINVINPFSSWANGTVERSDNIGLSSTFADGAAQDNRGFYWKIAANWGYESAPSRWDGYKWKDASSIRHERGLQSSSRTIDMGVGSDPEGIFFTDASSFGNSSGPGFSNWYTDDKSQQAYPNINTDITNALSNPDRTILGGNSQTPNDSGGAVYWQPPSTAFEVMIDFGNSHSDGPCSVCVWNNSTQQIEFLVKYGQEGSVDTGTSSLNDSNTGTLIYRHRPEYIYINTDHQGTIAGSHYYLYR